MRCVGLYGMLLSFATTLPLPTEDFGRPSKHSGTHFQITFHIREYSSWATTHSKLTRKSAFHLLFLLPKSSFGEHKLCKMIQKIRCVGFSGMLLSFVTTLCSPTKIYPSQTKILEGWTKGWNPDFRSTFQGREYSIWATNHWKVLPKIRISSFVHSSKIFVWGA
jgi:hypothetical protein